MPRLRAVLENVDDLDEGLREFYRQNDHGEFVLDLEDVDAHPTVRGLRRALDAGKQQRDEMRERLSAFKPLLDALGDDADLDGEIHKLVGRLGDNGGDDLESKMEGARKAIEAKYERELSKVQTRAQRLESELHDRLVSAELDAALEKAGVRPEVRPAVRALMKERGPKVLEADGGFRGVFPTDIYGVPEANQAIGEFIAEWSKSDDALAFIEPRGVQGSGAPQGRPNNGGGGRPRYTRDDLMSGNFDLDAVADGKAEIVSG